MATLEATLLPASDVGRSMRIQVPTGSDARPPRALVLRFTIGADRFARVWQLSADATEQDASAQDAGERPVYRHLGDTSSSFPGARDPEVELIARGARDVTELLEPLPRSA